MHIQKSGGVSVHTALERALPAGSISSRRAGRSLLAPIFDIDGIPEALRGQIAQAEDDFASMATSTVVSGHFTLDELLRIAPASEIATVLRAPGARLLSLYSFWRLTPGIRETWGPKGTGKPAVQYALGPLHEFLAEPSIALVTDNALCRVLLHGQGEIPDDAFIDPRDVPDVASSAAQRLGTLGFVGVLESEERLWEGLSRFFGVRLEPLLMNQTGAVGIRSEASPTAIDFSPYAVELLEQRTAADAVVYQRAIERWYPELGAADAVALASLGRHLLRIGGIAGAPRR